MVEGARVGKSDTCITDEALAKLPKVKDGHPEESGESCIFKRLRSFTAFRMTKTSFARPPILGEISDAPE
jgi:hypothetical protein